MLRPRSAAGFVSTLALPACFDEFVLPPASRDAWPAPRGEAVDERAAPGGVSG